MQSSCLKAELCLHFARRTFSDVQGQVFPAAGVPIMWRKELCGKCRRTCHLGVVSRLSALASLRTDGPHFPFPNKPDVSAGDSKETSGVRFESLAGPHGPQAMFVLGD